MFECVNARVNSLWLLVPDSVPAPMNRRMHEAVSQLDTFMYRKIEQRRKRGETAATSYLCCFKHRTRTMGRA